MARCKAIVYGTSKAWSWRCSNKANDNSDYCWRHQRHAPKQKAPKHNDAWAEYVERLKRAGLKPL